MQYIDIYTKGQLTKKTKYRQRPNPAHAHKTTSRDYKRAEKRCLGVRNINTWREDVKSWPV